MCLIASISWVGLLVILGLGWLALKVGGRAMRCAWRAPLTLVALASIAGGVFLIAHSSHRSRVVADGPPASRINVPNTTDIHEALHERVTRKVAQRMAELEERLDERFKNIPDVDVPDIDVPDWDDWHGDHGEGRFPFDGDREALGQVEAHRAGMSTVGKMALGSMLLICGWLLFNRGQTRGGALKVITLVGLAATGFILFSLFSYHATHEITHSHDRVVKVSTGDEPATVDDRPRETPRPTRAKRPVERAKRPVPRVPGELPPRAGEIPVAAELATKDPEAPQPPAADTTTESSASEPVAAESAATESAAAESKPADAAPDEKPSSKPAAVESSGSQPQESTADPSDGARPEWVDTPGRLVDSVYRVSINSGPYSEVPECQRALDEAMQVFVDDYIDQLMGAGSARLVDLDRNYLNQHIKKAEFDEVRQSTVGPMHQIHALLEIDEDARAAFHERWRRAVVTERLWYVGSAGAVLLALLSTFYGYSKLDEQTGGTHKGRLQLAATLMALVVAAGALLASWVAVPF